MTDDNISRLSKKNVSIIKAQSITAKSMNTFNNNNNGKKSLSKLKVRRTSYGFSGIPGIKPVEKTSQMAVEYKRPPLLYLPTFQLDPSVLFHIPSVKQAIDESLNENFTGHKYSPADSPNLALRLAGELMRKCKSMPFNRYRIISVVTLAQRRAQSYNNAVSFLWDHERDGYVDVTRDSSTAFIQVTVFAIYLD